MKFTIVEMPVIKQREYPYTEAEYSPNKYKGQSCVVVRIKRNGHGAENCECLILLETTWAWVPMMDLEFQCCSACGF